MRGGRKTTTTSNDACQRSGFYQVPGKEKIYCLCCASHGICGKIALPTHDMSHNGSLSSIFHFPVPRAEVDARGEEHHHHVKRRLREVTSNRHVQGWCRRVQKFVPVTSANPCVLQKAKDSGFWVQSPGFGRWGEEHHHHVERRLPAFTLG